MPRGQGKSEVDVWKQRESIIHCRKAITWTDTEISTNDAVAEIRLESKLLSKYEQSM